jgi:hypothetical protein
MEVKVDGSGAGAMAGPTHRKYDRNFNYLGRFDRDGNRVETPEEADDLSGECPACGCRHFVREGRRIICRHCRRPKAFAGGAAQEPDGR